MRKRSGKAEGSAYEKSCALLTHGGREAQRIGELSAGGTEIRVEATVAATRVIAQAALEGVEVGKDRLAAHQVVPMGRIAPKLVRRVAPLSLVVVGKREGHPTLVPRRGGARWHGRG